MKIFISYRRGHADHYASQLFERLQACFGDENVFYDEANVDDGNIIPDRIRDNINQASVVLVVIDPNLVQTMNERVEDGQDDYVRQEVAMAIGRKITGKHMRVLPVLVGGACMPSINDLTASLHEGIRPLLRVQPHKFSDDPDEWERQFKELCDLIKSIGPRTSFAAWLSSILQGPLVCSERNNLPVNAFPLGDSIVLDTARSRDGYGCIRLDQLHDGRAWNAERFRNFLTREEDRNWEEVHTRLEKAMDSGNVFCVQSLIPELRDDPVLRVNWSPCDYIDARAFHEIVENQSNASDRLLQHALEVLREGTSFPNILSNHAIVIFGEREERKLLMCHRAGRDRPGSYSRNKWSVSFEEQYAPEGSYGKEEYDSTIQQSVERGLREELLGNDYQGKIKIAVHGFQLEKWILNFGFLAAVELPDINDFNEIKTYWEKAVDLHEHDAIAALPLDEVLLWRCLMSGGLPTNDELIREKLLVGGEFDKLDSKDHLWHPTSPVRIALALWLSQQTE